MGIRDGVKMGDPVMIERNGAWVASGQIEKLYDNFAAATILKESGDGAIRQGDSVQLG